MPTAGLSLPKNQESLDCLGPWPQPYRAPLDALDNSFRCGGPSHGQHSLCAFILSIWGGGICWPRLSLSTLPHPWVHPIPVHTLCLLVSPLPSRRHLHGGSTCLDTGHSFLREATSGFSPPFFHTLLGSTTTLRLWTLLLRLLGHLAIPS